MAGAGAAVRGSRRVRRACVRRTRAKLPPRNGEIPGDPGGLRPVISAALLSLYCSRLPSVAGPGRQARRPAGPLAPPPRRARLHSRYGGANAGRLARITE